MGNEPTEPIIRHLGKKEKITYIGGEWHGEASALRRPFKDINHVAKPPKYLGDNQYEAAPGAIEYQTYYLRSDGPDLYYVHEDWIGGFPGNKDNPHETENQKLMREERERGGPRDLIAEGIIGHSDELKMVAAERGIDLGTENTELTKRIKEKREEIDRVLIEARCSYCLRASYYAQDIGKVCGVLKPGGKICKGTFVKAPRPIDFAFTAEEVKAQEDFELYGFGVLVAGKRIDPRTVKLIVNKNHPTGIALEKLIKNR